MLMKLTTGALQEQSSNGFQILNNWKVSASDCVAIHFFLKTCLSFFHIQKFLCWQSCISTTTTSLTIISWRKFPNANPWRFSTWNPAPEDAPMLPMQDYFRSQKIVIYLKRLLWNLASSILSIHIRLKKTSSGKKIFHTWNLLRPIFRGVTKWSDLFWKQMTQLSPGLKPQSS